MNNTNRLREHALKEVTVKIEGFKINFNHIIDFRISYSLDTLLPQASITIEDALRMDEELFQDGQKVLKISLRDRLEQIFETEFKIKSVKKKREKNITYLTFNLQEFDNIKLSTLFFGKGYKTTTVEQVIKDGLNGFSSGLNIQAPYVLQNWVTPINKPFIQTLDYFRRKYNLFIFRTKKEYVCIDVNTLLQNGLIDRSQDIKYIYWPDNFHYFNAVKNMKIEESHVYNLELLLPKSRTFISNMTDKKVKYFDYDLTQGINEINTPGGGKGKVTFDDNPTYKTLMRDKESEKITKKYFFKNIKDLKRIKIEVNSNIDLDVGTIVKMDVLESGKIYDQSKIKETLSGNWLIYSITEKLVKNNMTQDMVLIKPYN